MDATRMEQLKQQYGLSYHINFTVLAQQLVGLNDKRVLEVGGSLPSGLVLDEFGAREWVALEETDYWDETLATGHVLGTPPPLSGQRRYFKDATPDSMARHNLLYGRIENLPDALHGHFDVVFSIAAFEHIHKLPAALDKMYAALRPGGKLFSLFSPVWSAHDGHHLPEIMDKLGNKYNFGRSPIPPWGHLLMRPTEMYDHLLRATDDREFAQEVVYYVYQSNHINRFFLDDFLDIVARSRFKPVQVSPMFPMPVPADVQARLSAMYPGRKDFSNDGLLLVLERP
ncbi:MAG: class I SAM-dependent methyltransferase [Aquabacterium sp.]